MAFEKYLKNDEKSENTVAKYLHDLYYFLDFTQGKAIDKSMMLIRVKSPVLINLYSTDFVTLTIKTVKSGWKAIRENARNSVKDWDTAA